MEEKDTFGKFLRRKREECGLTQKEMARRLYVTESAVSKWERGISYPDISLVSQICGVLNISEHELITASEDMEQKKLEKQAASYQKMVHIYSVTMLVVYGIALVSCFITNLAVERRLSWFFIVLSGILTAFTLYICKSTGRRLPWQASGFHCFCFYLSVRFIRAEAGFLWPIGQ